MLSEHDHPVSVEAEVSFGLAAVGRAHQTAYGGQ